MNFSFESRVVFVPDPALWAEFTKSPSGTVGSDMRRRGRTLAFLASRTVGHKSGRLSRSIKSEYFAVKNPYVRVGSNVRHALMEHEGTRPHIILPHNRRLLRFKVKGVVVYAERVEHPGTRGSKYLSRHLRKVVND